MRIVLVNWAKVWDGARKGGGVNGYAQAIALELLARGHEVHWICSGTTYEPGRAPGTPGPTRIARHPDWMGVHVHEVVNSPVLAPSLDQFRDPLGEVTAPELERVIEQWAAQLRPEVVHWQNIEGFSAGCVEAIRRGHAGARQVFSLHNYHTICPQVYLMQGHRRPCHDSDGGHACATCIPAPDPAERKRALIDAARASTAESTWRRAWKALVGAHEPAAPPAEAPRFAGEHRGEAAEILARQRPHPWSEAGLSIPAWRPLLNVIQPEPACTKPPSPYGERRRAMVDMLNRCDAVLAVSEFVRGKFASMGVDAGKLQTVRIGSRMPELIAARPEALQEPDPIDDVAAGGRPIRLAFMGYNNWYKGLPMLVDSLELLVPEVLGRIHLSVLALGGEQMEPALRRLEPRLAGLRLVHGYTQDDLPWLLAKVDAGLVPSVWWDNGPQTVMEFQACRIPVIAAELGGIPDIITHGVNGLLFRGNDRWDLARVLAGVAKDPKILAVLRRGVRPIKSVREHVSELEAIYNRGADR